MIFDKLTNSKLYFGDERLKKGFEFLLNNDLETFREGKFVVEGENIFANFFSLKTKNENFKKFEGHRKYIDIQYCIKGKERMGFGLRDDFKNIVSPYDEDKDVEFLDGEKFSFVDVYEGSFAVFYPDDIHAPMLSVDDDIDIKKVIVKIKL